jgi:hypothetical protein
VIRLLSQFIQKLAFLYVPEQVITNCEGGGE